MFDLTLVIFLSIMFILETYKDHRNVTCVSVFWATVHYQVSVFWATIHCQVSGSDEKLFQNHIKICAFVLCSFVLLLCFESFLSFTKMNLLFLYRIKRSEKRYKNYLNNMQTTKKINVVLSFIKNYSMSIDSI